MMGQQNRDQGPQLFYEPSLMTWRRGRFLGRVNSPYANAMSECPSGRRAQDGTSASPLLRYRGPGNRGVLPR